MPLYYGVLPSSYFPAATTGAIGGVKLPASSAQFHPGNPSSTVSASLVMMGLANTFSPTSSGIVQLFLSGYLTVATAVNGATFGGRYGTLAGPATTVASGSSGAAAINTIASWAQPSAGVLDVASTTGYAASGTIWVTTSGSNQPAQISYTSITGGGTPSFNGCAFVAGTGANTVATSNAVTGSPQNGAAVVGTRFGATGDQTMRTIQSGAQGGDGWAVGDVVTLAAGTSYWIDMALLALNASDAASLNSVGGFAVELLA